MTLYTTYLVVDNSLFVLGASIARLLQEFVNTVESSNTGQQFDCARNIIVHDMLI